VKRKIYTKQIPEIVVLIIGNPSVQFIDVPRFTIKAINEKFNCNLLHIKILMGEIALGSEFSDFFNIEITCLVNWRSCITDNRKKKGIKKKSFFIVKILIFINKNRVTRKLTK